MRVSAYVLAGDPAWIPQSLQSFYSLVDRIFVSYDRSQRSWSGARLSVQESLARIRVADTDGKTVLLPGDYVDPSQFPMDLETQQRQAAIDAASDGAEWIIQLDSDEIMASPATFIRHLRRADSRGADALDYPSRWFYARTTSGRFLEACGRWWTTQSAYPGPLAVRSGCRLTHARQVAGAPTYRVDVSPWNTDPARPTSAPVHATIRPSQAVLHMSRVRTETQMLEKTRVSGHAASEDWTRELKAWRRRAAHPWWTSLRSPISRDPFRRFRVARLPPFANLEP